ncbi:hypothetical protein BD410DRAFT_901088 [Rickenella mellea]|uniref:BTB domain-containing protein n=1 Tax=Rickenella mellea TaxID=50990 RepID=A0A4Y7PRH4_9AGAM|nr:hypothetical protein BD410DRAFT_901088 [Rickenella mellea]
MSSQGSASGIPATTNPDRSKSGESQSMDKPTRVDEYYLSGGDVVFKVENDLFRVHSFFFTRESCVFRDMLTMPRPAEEILEGSADENPIYLGGITSIDFQRLLWVFYNPTYSIYDADIDTWTSIISLANLWQMDQVKDLAIRELGKMDLPAVTKAALANKYEIEQGWALAAYAEIGARLEPLTTEEGKLLGLDVVIRLAHVRERIRDRRATTPVETNSTRGFGAFNVSPLSSPIRPRSMYDGAAMPAFGAIAAKKLWNKADLEIVKEIFYL